MPPAHAYPEMSAATGTKGEPAGTSAFVDTWESMATLAKSRFSPGLLGRRTAILTRS